MTLRQTRATLRHPWHLLAATLAVLLSGCVSMPLPNLATPLPAHWRNEPASIAPKPPDLSGWWHGFDDTRLNALVEQSLHSNLDIAEAVERLRAARALYGSRDAPFLPSVRFRTDNPIDPDASASFFLVGFDALWEFGLFGRRQGAERETQGHLAAAVADLQEARVSMIAEVVRNWIDLRAAQQQVRVLTRIHESRQRKLRLLKVRANLKLIAPADLARARAADAAADADVSAPRQAENAAAQRLALLLGRSEPDPAWLQPGPLPQLGAQDLSSVPANLLRTRPGIARAEAEVLTTAGQLGIASADRFPRIGLGGSIDWSTSILSHRDAPTNKIASFGPTIRIPLLDWGLRQAKFHAQDHQLKASVLAYRKAVLSGIAEVEIALGNLDQQRHREHASHAAWQALTQAAKSEAKRQHLGLASGIDQADSDIAREQAQIDVIDARSARDIAYIALYKALGGAPKPRTDDAPKSDHAVSR